LFAEPQVFTIDAVAQSLNRTGSSETGGRYGTADRAHRLEINHQRGRRNRDQFKLTRDTLVANPLVSGQNVQQSISVYLVVDTPVGYDTAAAKKVVDGFITNLTASSGANIVKLLGGEN
jgi:hypothetical protein